MCELGDLKGNGLVFDLEKIKTVDVIAENFDITIDDFKLNYMINVIGNGEYLSAKKINLIVTKPLESDQAYDELKNWKFKNFVDVKSIENLTIITNMAFSDHIKEVFKSNNLEPSFIFDIIKEYYEKVTLTICDEPELDVEIELETFNVEDEEKTLYPEESENDKEDEEKKSVEEDSENRGDFEEINGQILENLRVNYTGKNFKFK